MTFSSRNILLWLPRILTILFSLFLAIFALDVFNEFSGFFNVLGSLLIHLIPSFIILLVLFISWKKEWFGAIIFFGVALWYIVMSYGKFTLFTYVVISGPLILISVLFLLNWILKNYSLKSD